MLRSQLMKQIITIILVCIASLSFADQKMSEEQIMQQTRAVEECFAKIDQSNFAAIEARGKEMEKEIKALCDSGKRDEAMNVAMKYSMEFSESAEMKEMQKCSKLMQEMMAGVQMPHMSAKSYEVNDDEHICDGM